jgi:hypothetical protein
MAPPHFPPLWSIAAGRGAEERESGKMQCVSKRARLIVSTAVMPCPPLPDAPPVITLVALPSTSSSWGRPGSRGMESPMAVVRAGTVATRASCLTLDGRMHGVNVFMARVTAARRFTWHGWKAVGVAWPRRVASGRRQWYGDGRARTQDGGRCPVSCSHRSSQKWLHWRRAQTGRHKPQGRVSVQASSTQRALSHTGLRGPPAGWCTHVFEEEVVPVPQVLPAHASQQVLDLGGGQWGGADDQGLPELGAPGHNPGGRLKHAARAATSHATQ